MLQPRVSAHHMAPAPSAKIASEIVHAASWGRRRRSHRSSVLRQKATATSVAAAASAAFTAQTVPTRGPSEEMSVTSFVNVCTSA